MMTGTIEHGEIHCLLCGRYLADIRTTSDGHARLRRAPHGEHPAATVKLVGRRLHCARCGGRAFIEWDLTTSASASASASAA
jgi:hypothetical protein